MITEKENYLRLVNGEMPEWLPRMSMGPDPNGKPPCYVHLRPSCLSIAKREDGVLRDWFGVEYAVDSQGGAPPMPNPNKILLDDITKWRDVVKLPNLDEIDWEDMAKKDLEKVDRENTAVAVVSGGGYFQALVGLMGFEGALMAPLEDEDETKALLAYISDFYCDFMERACDYYDPDLVDMVDDNASSLNPFFSLDLYREFYKPLQLREGMIAVNRGLAVSMHDCGHCELFIDDWMDFGVRIWNPAQISNDLLGIKKKYKGRLALAGCWDSQGAISLASTGEEETRAAVRTYVDTYAPGGGFCFAANALGMPGDPAIAEKNRWIAEEYEAYGRNWYQTH